MKLYVVAGSGNCRKVQATISNLNITVDIEYLDMLEGELATPEYLALNPNGKVPTLVDGDFTLWESNAIMQYLADKVPDSTLFSQEAHIRADIIRWQCWELAHFNNALGSLAFESVFKPRLLEQKPVQATIDAAVESLKSFAAVLETHLADRDYLVGNNITLADYSMANFEGFRDVLPFDWADYPRLDAYFKRLHHDPHWADRKSVV